MSDTEATTILPRFSTDEGEKRATVTLSLPAYVELLIDANVTDPAMWPPGMQSGAQALKRIREIEKESTAAHGCFDWEKLNHTTQDEYDGLSLLLDRLCDTGERFELSEVLRELDIESE